MSYQGRPGKSRSTQGLGRALGTQVPKTLAYGPPGCARLSGETLRNAGGRIHFEGMRRLLLRIYWWLEVRGTREAMASRTAQRVRIDGRAALSAHAIGGWDLG
jgi:hypothetical protein